MSQLLGNHIFSVGRCGFGLLALFLCANISAQNAADSLQVQIDSVAAENVAVADSASKKSRWDTLLDWKFLAVPTVAYQPETRWAFGVAGAYYFNCKEQTKVSDIYFDGAYTLNKQWNANVLSTVYFGGGTRWFMYAKVGFKRYPDYFYGIGNDTKRLLGERIAFSSDNVTFSAQPQCYVGEHWIVGASVDFRWEKPSTSVNLDSVAQFCSVAGLDRSFVMLGLGALVSYDSRDTQFYPHRGIFFKAVGNYYEPYLGSTYRMGSVAAEFRQFVPIYKDLIFAWQVKTDFTFGKNKPVQMLPTLGGLDEVRGIRRGQFRDDVALALQAELRIPIWRFLKATVFGGIGDVYNLQNWQFAVPKVGYGAGLRVAVNKAKVNVRFDVARSNINPSWKLDGWNFYLTIKEAF